MKEQDIICEHCGKEIPSSGVFCPYCHVDKRPTVAIERIKREKEAQKARAGIFVLMIVLVVVVVCGTIGNGLDSLTGASDHLFAWSGVVVGLIAGFIVGGLYAKSHLPPDITQQLDASKSGNNRSDSSPIRDRD